MVDCRLERTHPRVLRFTGTPADGLSSVFGSVLQVGSVGRASHETALWLQGVQRIRLELVVSVPPGRSHLHCGIRVHRFSDLRPEHLEVVRGVPTTSLPRAVVDVTSVFRPKRLANLVDSVTITTRATTVGAIARAYGR